MRAELKILWDGTGHGLPEHRLSIAAFSKPLSLLLKAIRRIASNKIKEATDTELGGRGGRLARAAEQIDLQIGIPQPGCVQVLGEVVFPEPATGSQVVMFDDLMERTLEELIEAIDGESQGLPRSVAVRKFLRSMDGIVATHSYTASVNGRVLGEVRMGEPRLLAEPVMSAYLVSYCGHVSGVLFDPKPEVRIRHEGQTLRLMSTIEDVDRALALRGEAVTVYAARVDNGLARLVNIVRSDRPTYTPTTEERRSHLVSRWGGLLERLAE